MFATKKLLVCVAVLMGQERMVWAATSTSFQMSSSSVQNKLGKNSTTYSIIQTIKSSFDQIGPLQCETVCEVKGDAQIDSCVNRPLPACAANCAKKCLNEKQYAQDGFRYKVCVEGCTQFCSFHDCCGSSAASSRGGILG